MVRKGVKGSELHDQFHIQRTKDMLHDLAFLQWQNWLVMGSKAEVATLGSPASLLSLENPSPKG